MRIDRDNRWASAIAHLRAADPRWGPPIDRIGPCQLRPRRDRFGTLVRAIIGQQISSRAAAAIDARLRDRAGSPHEPRALLDLGEAGLRAVGLSGVKARYVLNLAEAVGTGRIPLRRIGTRGDAEIIARLTAVKGIGTWTAEMFLIFALNRPDVLPVGDLGVRSGLRDYYGLADLPTPRVCVALAEPWRPFRTVAMWYLWKAIDTRSPVPADDHRTGGRSDSPARPRRPPRTGHEPGTHSPETRMESDLLGRPASSDPREQRGR
jgi:DNA-3-methyladenine glycosylase II